jgi:hypothetical protein
MWQWRRTVPSPTTGDIKVAGAGGVRKVLEFNGLVDGPHATTVRMPYVQVESFLATPATQMTVALWLKPALPARPPAPLPQAFLSERSWQPVLAVLGPIRPRPQFGLATSKPYQASVGMK